MFSKNTKTQSSLHEHCDDDWQQPKMMLFHNVGNPTVDALYQHEQRMNGFLDQHEAFEDDWDFFCAAMVSISWRLLGLR